MIFAQSYTEVLHREPQRKIIYSVVLCAASANLCEKIIAGDKATKHRYSETSSIQAKVGTPTKPLQN